MAGKAKQKGLKGRGGLVAVGLTVVLGVWLIADLRSGKPRGADDAPPISDYVRLKSTDVTRVELKRSSGGFTLARQGDDWVFEAPGRYRANGESVRSWLKGLLEDGTVAREIEGKPDPNAATYGLDKPSAELVLTGRGGTRTLQVGRAFPGMDSAGSYAREARDGRLFLLSSSDTDQVKTKKVDDLREKRLLVLADEKAVRKISVRHGEQSVEVAQKGDRWEVLQPFAAPADKDDVTSLISQFHTAEAESFAPDADLAKYGLDRPQLSIQVEEKGGTRGIRFGSAQKDGRVHAVREGETEILVVSKTTFEDLQRQSRVGQLRERKLVSFDREKITSIELTNKSGTTKLQKAGSDWEIVDAPDPKSKKAKADQVQTVLDAVTRTATRHVEEAPADLAKYGLDKPEITVRVNEGTATSQVVMIGKKADDGYYAKGQPNAVFEVASFTHSDLNVKPAAFKPDAAAEKK